MILKYDFASGQNKMAPLNDRLSEVLNQLDNAFVDLGLDAIVLTSKDPFISEYVPLENNPRYGATGFTGSVGDAIFWTKNSKAEGIQKRTTVFVDGRYHLQADRECPLNLVEVVKLDVEPSIEGMLRDRLSVSKGLRIGIDFERTAIASLEKYQDMARASGHTLVHLDGEKILKALGLPGWNVDRPIFSLPETSTGRTIAKNLDAMKADLSKLNERYLHVTAATDDAAFLLNARGYHLPNVSSFLAYTFAVGNEIILFLPACSANSPVELDESQKGAYQVTVIRNDLNALKTALSRHAVDEIFYNGSTMNGLLPTLLKEVFPKAKLNGDTKWVIQRRTRKTKEEMQSIRDAFQKSSRAIAKTLRWGKKESQQRQVSEVDLAKHLYQSYANEGAVALSFKTISGAGPNSAIIHYSTPSTTTYFEKGQLALLDSGAYYDDGFCTDCTRGFFVGSNLNGAKPEAWQMDIYTAALKSAIQVFLGPVSGKLSGKEVDALIRAHVKAAGYDYLHGTGHGIGIHVHEEGIRFSTLSIYPQSPFSCVSVEPGIYLQDQGGVRIENVVFLHPQGGDYKYENVVFVGYDWDLIDVSKLTPAEKKYLKSYEAECRKLGTHLTECPL
jgi:Xaa-Pro aminopeptidase